MAVKAAYDFQPLILVGAGRSGTKILRDVLATHPDIDCVPFDVNYIWTIGNTKADHDQLSPNSLAEADRQRIIQLLAKQSQGAPFLLEKTVSNTLRLPFVLKVFPEARFIHLIRDGRDVTESVSRQWGETREISYFFKKLKTFPLRYAFSYLMGYGYNWIKHSLGKSTPEDYIWGVRYPGYLQDLKEKTTLEVCATQWVACVETCLEQLTDVDPNRQVEVRYEALMLDPQKQLQRIADFIGVDGQFESSRFNSKNIGKHKAAFSKEQMESLHPILFPTLTKLNYN